MSTKMDLHEELSKAEQSLLQKQEDFIKINEQLREHLDFVKSTHSKLIRTFTASSAIGITTSLPILFTPQNNTAGYFIACSIVSFGGAIATHSYFKHQMKKLHSHFTDAAKDMPSKSFAHMRKLIHTVKEEAYEDQWSNLDFLDTKKKTNLIALIPSILVPPVSSLAMVTKNMCLTHNIIDEFKMTISNIYDDLKKEGDAIAIESEEALKAMRQTLDL